MHYDFDLKIDKVDSLSKSDFNVAEKDWLLNEAQLVLIKTRYGIRNNDQLGFEGNQKRVDDLSSLVVKHPLQPALTPLTLSNGVLEVRLSDLVHPYLFLIRAYASAQDCNDLITLKFIQHDDLNYLLDDPFNQPSKLEVPYNFGRSSADTGSSIYIYPGSVNITQVYFDYLKFPQRVNLGNYTFIDGTVVPQTDSELPEHLHNEIVDVAVQIASGIIEHPQYVQLKTQKLFTNE